MVLQVLYLQVYNLKNLEKKTPQNKNYKDNVLLFIQNHATREKIFTEEYK